MNTRQVLTDVLRTSRMVNRLADAGIKVRHNRRLTRMTNIQMRGGRLDDATCHYAVRCEVEGNTYPLRAALKGLGLQWDPQYKVWHCPAFTADLEAIFSTICRELQKN